VALERPAPPSWYGFQSRRLAIDGFEQIRQKYRTAVMPLLSKSDGHKRFGVLQRPETLMQP
jgi:hypothetical protein